MGLLTFTPAAAQTTIQTSAANIRRTSMATMTARLLATLLLGTLSIGANAKHYGKYARVTQVTPLYKTHTVREPYQECHLEERATAPRKHHHRNTSVTPTIIGALIGGAIGNELGHNKSNKRVGAVAGAILGGSIANDLKRQPRHHHSNHTAHTTTEKVCTTRYQTRHEKQITAYDVDYRYRGQTYSTVMHSHPGDRIRVAVDVTPIGY